MAENGERRTEYSRPLKIVCPPSSVIGRLIKANPRRRAGGLREELAGRTTGLPATSGHLEVFGRCLAAIGHELVLDGLPFVERAETSALHRGNMDEHVLVSARRPNEPVAFSW